MTTFVDHPAPEEQGPERAEREHHEREPGVGSPVLADDLACGCGPAAVTERDADRVARPHVPRDGLLEAQPARSSCRSPALTLIGGPLTARPSSGGRFSANAFGPSLASSLEKTSAEIADSIL